MPWGSRPTAGVDVLRHRLAGVWPHGVCPADRLPDCGREAPDKAKDPPGVGGLRDESELVALVDNDGGSQEHHGTTVTCPLEAWNRMSTWWPSGASG